MQQKKITVTKTVVINFLSTILIQGISFLTAPLFLRLLGADQFGTYSLFASRVSLLASFIGLGAAGGIALGRYDFKDEYYEFRSSTLLFSVCVSRGVTLLGVIFLRPLSQLVGFSPTVTLLIFLSAMSIQVCNFAHGCFVYEKKPVRNLIYTVVLSLLNVGVSFFMIYRLPQDERAMARILGYAVSYLAVAVVVGPLLFFKKPYGLNKRYNKYSIAIGFPLIFHTLANMLLIHSDRIMMQHMGIPNADIGIYTAFYSFSSILLTILTALNTSWTPYYYDDLKEEAWERLDRKCKNYMELFTVLACGFMLLCREVSGWYAGEEYMAGVNVLPLLVLSVYFIFMYQFPVNFEMFHKKTPLVAAGTIGAALVNVVLNYFMIRAWGMYGAAIATVSSYALLFTAHFIAVRFVIKEQKFHLHILRFLPGFLCVGACFAAFYLPEGRVLLSVLDIPFSTSSCVRWGLGAALGAYEAIRVIRRKKLF